MAPACLVGGAGVEDSDPLSAASRLKGNDVEDAPPEKEGGSMRENGAEMRRVCLRLAILRLVGERPAGAVIGVRDEEDRPRAGVDIDIRDGKAEGGGIDFAEVRLNVKGFASLLLFLRGDIESNMPEPDEDGSTFSLSKSLKVEGSKERLLVPVGLLEEMLILPPFMSFEDDFCARTPETTGKSRVLLYSTFLRLTILAILGVGEMLKTRTIQWCEWHSGH